VGMNGRERSHATEHRAEQRGKFKAQQADRRLRLGNNHNERGSNPSMPVGYEASCHRRSTTTAGPRAQNLCRRRRPRGLTKRRVHLLSRPPFQQGQLRVLTCTLLLALCVLPTTPSRRLLRAGSMPAAAEPPERPYTPRTWLPASCQLARAMS